MNRADKQFLKELATISTTENARRIKVAGESAARHREDILGRGLKALSDGFKKAREYANERTKQAVGTINGHVDKAADRVINDVNRHTTQELDKREHFMAWYDHVIAIIIGLVAGFVAHALCSQSAASGNRTFLKETASLITQKVGDVDVYVWATEPNQFKIWLVTIAVGIVVALFYYVILVLASTTRGR